MKLIIISEFPCCRLGLATILSEVDPIATVLEVKSINDLVDLKDECGKIDVVLLDTPMQSGHDMAAIAQLQAIDGIGAVILIHGQDRTDIVRRYLDTGVAGVVSKRTEAPVLVNAVRLVLSGGRYVPESILAPDVSEPEEPRAVFEDAGLKRLTRRQMDVLKELGRGASNQEIGTQLGIALATVKLHVNAILNTLGVRNRTEAAIIAYRAGITRASEPA
ncbi:MAG: hypothetical protein COA62_09075 [Rhodobiaceae bacterium]|nr:MAG: hypothetical protein COA62_09075 [Rhodobiaceae bacterium]